MSGNKLAFISRQPWQSQRPEALVVCCSDGRWHAQVEDFIHDQVSSRADLLVVPGGPATFSIWSSSFEESRGMQKAFSFLAAHHNLKSVWLIAHENCAYYRQKHPSADPASLQRRQLDDLARAQTAILKWRPAIQTRRVYASLQDSLIKFQVLD
jgi:carbonic anhydrase